MIKKAWEKDKRKVKKLVEGNNFDYFILSLICIDAVALGFMTSDITNVFFDNVLFILDRLCMAIFIMEMLMKLYAYGKGFFKSGWNVFDLAIVAVSSVPFAGTFIVLRTFRLFRLFKFVHRWPLLGMVIDTFLALVPAVLGLGAAAAVFYYAFAVIATNLYGDIFVEFETLGSSLLMTLETFGIGGWMTPAAARVMDIFPHAWIFFGIQSVVAFLLVVSFVAAAVAETVKNLERKGV